MDRKFQIFCKNEEGPLGAAGGRWGPLGAAGGRWWPLGAAGGRWGPLGAAGGRWGPLGAAGGRWWPLVAAGGRWGPLGSTGQIHLPPSLMDRKFQIFCKNEEEPYYLISINKQKLVVHYDIMDLLRRCR